MRPLKLLALAAAALLLVGAWLYRDQLPAWVRSGSLRPPPVPAAAGSQGTTALARARTKLAALGRPDTRRVTLSADEMASLIGDGLAPEVRRELDSIRVELGEGRLGLAARLRTARLSPDLLGPLGAVLRPHEPIQAAGAIRIVRPGVAEWELDQLTLRDFPIPREAIPRLIGRAFGDSARRSLQLNLPRGVRDVRVSPGGVTLSAAPP